MNRWKRLNWAFVRILDNKVRILFDNTPENIWKTRRSENVPLLLSDNCLSYQEALIEKFPSHYAIFSDYPISLFHILRLENILEQERHSDELWDLLESDIIKNLKHKYRIDEMLSNNMIYREKIIEAAEYIKDISPPRANRLWNIIKIAARKNYCCEDIQNLKNAITY